MLDLTLGSFARVEANALLNAYRSARAEKSAGTVGAGLKNEAKAGEQAAVKAEGNAVAKAEGNAGRDLACCANCFAAGTPVLTATGLQPIESIKVGDLVAARDEKTGAQEYKPVIALIATPAKPVFSLVLTDSVGKTESITVTDDHPFWVLSPSGNGESHEGKWVASGQIEAGMRVLTHGGQAAKVISLSKQELTLPTYNFTVADFHTYFVGTANVWVHNQGPCSCGPGNKGYAPSREASLDSIFSDMDKYSLSPISDRQKGMIQDKLPSVKETLHKA